MLSTTKQHWNASLAARHLVVMKVIEAMALLCAFCDRQATCAGHTLGFGSRVSAIARPPFLLAFVTREALNGAGRPRHEASPPRGFLQHLRSSLEPAARCALRVLRCARDKSGSRIRSHDDIFLNRHRLACAFWWSLRRKFVQGESGRHRPRPPSGTSLTSKQRRLGAPGPVVVAISESRVVGSSLQRTDHIPTPRPRNTWSRDTHRRRRSK